MISTTTTGASKAYRGKFLGRAGIARGGFSLQHRGSQAAGLAADLTAIAPNHRASGSMQRTTALVVVIAAVLVTMVRVADAQSGPTVVTQGPGSGTVSVASDIYLDFNEEVFSGSGSIVVNGGVGDVRTFNISDATQVTIRGNRLTLKPTTDLTPNKAYSVQVDAGAVQNSSGNAFAGISGTGAFAFSTGNVIYTQAQRGNSSTQGAGTLANPYQSLGHASLQATAGSTIYVLASGSTVARSYDIAAVGSVAAPVYMKPAPGASGTYQFTGLNNFRVAGSQNLVIEGFTIDGGANQIGVYDIASNATTGFWTQQTAVALGGIGVNVVSGTNVVIRDNVFQHLQQKAVNIENGRYVDVLGNVIHDVATTSLSGGHGIMRQQGSGNFGTADEAGNLRWDISGNLLFNVEQRLYSWVPSKGYLNMTLDEGKPINIDETTDTSMTARISDNVVAYPAIDAIRLKPTPNLDVSNNSVYATGVHADGITDINTLGGSNRFPGMTVRNNLVMTATSAVGMELNDSFPTATDTGRVSGNILSGGGVNPSGLPGVTLVTGTSLFVNPEAGNFTPTSGVPTSTGAHATVLADLQRKVQAKGITVAPDGWVTDHLKLTQTLLDAIPGLEDGVAGNETIFDAPGTYAASGREAGRKSLFFQVDSTWKAANVTNANLVGGLYELITPAEYSDWRDGVATAFPGYGSIRWGDSVIGQNKVFASDSLLVASISGTGSYTQTIAAGRSITLGGDLLIDFDGYTPLASDTFDLIEAASITPSGASPFLHIFFADSLPSGWGYDLSIIDGVSSDVVRLSFVASPSGVPEIDPSGLGSVLFLVTGVLGLVERRSRRRPVPRSVDA